MSTELPASSLDPDDVYQIFGLEEEQVNEFLPTEQEQFLIPPELGKLGKSLRVYLLMDI